jgi:hypothetical protein
MGWFFFFIFIFIIIILIGKSQSKFKKLPAINKNQPPMSTKAISSIKKKTEPKKILYEDDYPDDELEGNDDFKFINTTIVGVTYKNKDRTSRQRIIKECKIGDHLLLMQAPDERNNDEYEFEDGIKVCRQNNEQLGWLAEYLASEIIELFDKGWKNETVITDLTGGTENKPTRGCNIKIELKKQERYI